MIVNVFDEALTELYSIYAKLIADDNAKSDQFVVNFYKTIDRLKLMPLHGKVFKNKDGIQMRSIPILGFHLYLIFYYLPDKTTINIARVLYAGMDLDSVFGDADNN